MMRLFLLAAVIIIITIFQAAIPADWSFKPNLLLVLLTLFSIYCPTTHAIITSFSIGLAADLIAPVMGPNIISFGIIGTLLTYFRRVVTIKTTLYQVIAIFITGLLTGFLTSLLCLLKNGSAITDAARTILSTSLFSAVVGPVLFPPITWLLNLKKNKHEKP